MRLKKIKTSDLQIGMTVQRVDTPWLFSPFKTKNFSIQSQKDIDKLISYNISEVYVFGGSDEPVDGHEIITVNNTFEVDEAELQVGTEIPVDVYSPEEDGHLTLFLHKGITYSEDVYDIVRSAGIRKVRIPESQRSDFGKYKELLGSERDVRHKEGYTGRYLDPREVENHYRFMSLYFPINHVALIPGSKPDFDIYARRDGKITKALTKGEAVGSEELAAWSEMNENLVIRIEDRPAYRAYLMGQTRKDWRNRWARVAFVRENSRIVMAELSQNPRSKKLIKEARDSVDDIIEVVLENPTTFYALMKINNHDYYTFTHSVNVSTLSVALAMTEGLKKREDLLNLAAGAMLHDLGKSFVDSRIINKPGKYTDKEFEIVTNHVTLGYDALKSGGLLSETALIPVLQHHEKLSGSGYPKKLQGDQIHLFGRISGIIDVYDALTTERPYRKALSPFDALNLMSVSKDDFDARLFNKFVLLLGEQEKGGPAG